MYTKRMKALKIVPEFNVNFTVSGQCECLQCRHIMRKYKIKLIKHHQHHVGCLNVSAVLKIMHATLLVLL